MPFSDYFNPDWKNTDENVRLRALDVLAQSIKNKKSLKIIQKMILNDHSQRVKEKALGFVSDAQKIEFILNKVDSAIQRELLETILEKILLHRINTDSQENDSLEEGIKPIINLFKNEIHLKNLFLKTSESGWKKHLLLKITDFNLLYQIYLLDSQEEEIQKKLLDRLKAYPEFLLINELEGIIHCLEAIQTKLHSLEDFQKNTLNHEKFNQLRQNYNTAKQKWNHFHQSVVDYSITSLRKKYQSIILDIDQIIDIKKKSLHVTFKSEIRPKR